MKGTFNNLFFEWALAPPTFVENGYDSVGVTVNSISMELAEKCLNSSCIEGAISLQKQDLGIYIYIYQGISSFALFILTIHYIN